MDLSKELEKAKQLILEAGEKIMEIYKNEDFQVEQKGAFPVTQADKEANTLILNGLKNTFPDYGILSEESEDDKSRLEKKFIWIIDPLDGTKEFISKNGEFTVNIGLVHEGKPVLGVILIPEKDELFYAVKDKGAFFEKEGEINRIHVTKKDKISEMVLAISRSHATEKEEQFIKDKNFKEIKKIGSSLKGCRVAQGVCDVYLRSGPTKEWDICAMNCIIEEAGGKISDLKGNLLKYNKVYPGIEGFLISNGSIHEDLLN